MFTFFHRKTKITVDCFTPDKTIYETTPIVKAIKTVPDWWKKLPKIENIDYNGNRPSNMKSCIGFIDLYKRGFVLESWTDFELKLLPDNSLGWKVSNWNISQQLKKPAVMSHAKMQYGSAFPNHIHAKLLSPWRIRSKQDHFFMFSPSTWALDNFDFTILPGVVEYYIQCATHINMLLPLKNTSQLIHIPIGQSLAHIIPLNESYEYELKNHLVSFEEWNKIEYNMTSTSMSKMSGYNTIKTLLTRNQDREKSRCPFS